MTTEMTMYDDGDDLNGSFLILDYLVSEHPLFDGLICHAMLTKFKKESKKDKKGEELKGDDL